MQTINNLHPFVMLGLQDPAATTSAGSAVCCKMMWKWGCTIEEKEAPQIIITYNENIISLLLNYSIGTYFSAL